MLSLSKQMPRDSSLYVQLDYKPKFLNFEQFPADPNRGFDVPPSIATFSCPAIPGYQRSSTTSTGTTTLAYSNALLIMPPVPDLSMPFNVISIASTFFALIIGTTINITIKKCREQVTDQLQGKVKPTPKDKLKAKLARFKNKFRKDKLLSDASGGTMSMKKEKAE